jgi:two-component SAPR family response regulator
MSPHNEQTASSEIDTAGCRVLVVEDETLIAVLIEETLVAMECKIVGPAAKLETALQLAVSGGFDIAILDITVRGGKVFPVADELLARGIPFVLASGYGDWALPNTLQDQRRLLKPFTPVMLEREVKVLCGKAAELRAKQ